MHQDALASTDYQPAQLPLPIATGGIGLLLSLLVPGGLSGGQGFVAGFLVGTLVLAFSRAAVVRGGPAAQATARCPHCERPIELRRPGIERNGDPRG
jgi:hypothetical protein